MNTAPASFRGAPLRALLAAAAATLLPAAAAAQAGADDARIADLRSRREAKLESKWLATAGWTTDFAIARQRAAAQDRFILAYFSRSYAPCAPCKALEESLLATEAFQTWAKDAVVPFCHVTSHLPDEPQPLLLREKGGQAFPYLAVLDADGQVVAHPQGRTLADVQAAIETEAPAFLQLAERARSGDEAAARQLLVRRIELDQFADFDATYSALDAAGLAEPELTRLRGILAEQEFNLILGTVTDQRQAAAGGARALPMFRAGRVVAGPLASYYWGMLAAHAIEARDAKLLAELVAQMKSSDDARVRGLLPRFERALQGLDGGR